MADCRRGRADGAGDRHAIRLHTCPSALKQTLQVYRSAASFGGFDLLPNLSKPFGTGLDKPDYEPLPLMHGQRREVLISLTD